MAIFRRTFRIPGKGQFQISSRGMATFNRDIFQTNWKKINESPLKRAGLLARRIMINMIRKDKSKKQLPAKPGRPPKSRAEGHPFRRIFSVPKGLASVVVGHVGFRRRTPTVMETHEFGERVTKKVLKPTRRSALTGKQRRAARRLFQAGRIQRASKVEMVEKQIQYPKRPFAEPTLKKATDRFPALWANSVSGVKR